MRMITLKMKPKTIFGIIMLVVGVVVICLSFLTNHSAKPASTSTKIDCSTTEKRVEYINSFGYQTDSKEESKKITIPKVFNDVYKRYNAVQKKQGFNLESYKGKSAVLYTYTITNYENNDNVIANLVVVDGALVGADLCDTSADNGFLVGLNE